MSDTTLSTFRDYAATHGLALFPCAAGTKRPIIKWKDGSTPDPAAWATWHQEQHNLAIDCAKSGLIMLDVDSSKVSRETAWQAYHDLCVSWGLPSASAPSTQSARGGWHIPFRRPSDMAATDLRGGGTLVKISDLRELADGERDGEVIGFKNRGYCIAPGSTLVSPHGDLPYLFMPGAAAPQACPAALVDLLKLPVIEATYTGETGTSDIADVAKLVAELDMFGEFSVEPDWFRYMGAIKLALGDTEQGVEVALQMTQDDATEEAFWSRWKRLASVDDGSTKCRIGSMIHRYEKLTGSKFRVGKSTRAMFSGVANTVARLAADVGASLPPPPGASLLTGNTQKVIADLGQPILDDFFETTKDVPLTPKSTSPPQLPAACEEVYPALYEQMNSVIRRIVAMAETPRSFKQQRVLRVLSVLHLMHEATYQALVDRINGLGCALTPMKLEQQNNKFEIELTNQLQGIKRTSFHADAKNKPDPAISDNVAIFLNRSNHRARYDLFPKRVEISSGTQSYTRLDQDELDRLWMTAKSSDYNYHPAKDVFRSGIKVKARDECYDSLEDKVLELSRKWDRLPRLDTWLTQTCGVESNSLNTAIGRNLIGGMVSRARRPGCVQSETVIFISPEQGTGKSSICRILALKDDWFLGSYKFGGSQQSSLPLLAGKWIVELGELAGLNKTDFEDVKTFLSETKDEYVAKYESEPTENLRRCVFIGTSNIRQPLADPSGNRRFLPVHVVGEIDLDWLRGNVEQLIGEAAFRDEQNESFAIPKEIWSLTKAAQEAARNLSPVEEAIYEWFDREGSFYILAADVRRALEMTGLRASSRYGVFMEKIGWRHIQANTPGRDRVWIKHHNNDTKACVVLEPAANGAFGRVEMRCRLPPLPPLPGPPISQ